jgi:MFS family permease
MSYGELLSLSLGGFVLFGLGALPTGWLGDRWSAEHMMVVFFVGTGGAAISAGLAGSPVALALGLAATGLFGSIYHPVGTAWLVRNAANRGRAFGWNGISGSIGLTLRCRRAGTNHILARRVHHSRDVVRRGRGGLALPCSQR